MKKILVIATLMLVIGSSVFATNGMRMIGFGPVQRSMGGASVGASLDAASVLTNPAGIVDLGSRVDFGASYFSPDVSYEMMGTEFESDKKASPVPAFGLVVPLMENLSFGLGAYGISGMGVDYNMSAMNMILNTSYSQMRFAPGLAYRINDMVSVGGTLNVMYATMEYSMYNPMATAQFVNMGATAFGLGGTFGVTVKPNDMVTVGLAYETQSFFQDFEFNQYASTPSVSENNLDFDIPQSVTLGLSVKPVSGLLVAADVQWIQWSATSGDDLPEFTGGNFNMQWSDQFVYKLGLQYDVTSMLTARAGFNYAKHPLEEDDAFAQQANAFFPAVAETHYTYGVGVALSDQITVDLGGMYSPEKTADAANGETTMSQYSVDMGIALNF